MKPVLVILEMIVGFCLIVFILLQNSKGGLGSAFGGGEVYRTKRGAEKIIFTSTIVSASLFLLLSIVNLIVR